MKLTITPAALARAREAMSKKAPPTRRLPGESHSFVPMTPARVPGRNLVPPQFLEGGVIVSSRLREVTRGEDPLLARVRELEAEVARLRTQLETQHDTP